MSKVPPYHTNSPEYEPRHREVYHDDDDCYDGKAIQQRPAKVEQVARCAF